ncbi:MAG: putative lipid II flippase FtsW [Spirochaetales bacterium]|nr:putative lipid II flippase FtsW [Spirochaetales bacterium]
MFLILILVLLIGTGISILFSASYYHAERLGKNPWYFLVKQATWILFGSLIAYFMSHISLDFVKKAIPWILLGAFILSLLTFFPVIGEPISGARRWIFIFGQSFQPSEFAKFALVLYLAYILSRKKDNINDPVMSVLPPLIVVLVFVVIIYFQNDFSTAFFIFFIALAIFFIANIKMIYFIILGALIIPAGTILLFTKVYWVKKLIVFLSPGSDPAGTGWQILQAHTALARGGFLGKGLGKGIKKLGVLPEAHTDFIFAVIGEEVGFLGILFILGLFICFTCRGYLISFRCRDPFKYYLSFGVTSIIFFQAILNMAVVVGLIPATGIPLPFFSLGGSSIFMTLIMIGLLLNISRENKESGWRYT